MGITSKITQEEFINKSIKIHGDKYDYSQSIYINAKTKVDIICKKHGLFSTRHDYHWKCGGCVECTWHTRTVLTGEEYCPDGSKVLPLTKGKYTLVDEEDYEIFVGYNWAYNGSGYAENQNLGKLHRVIMKATDSTILVDHINGDKLDNRKNNLRFATNLNNSHNSKGHRNSSSIYKGVSWQNKSSVWHAKLRKGDQSFFLGSFKDEEEAAKAYDAKAKELQGEFAYLNFPEEVNNV